MRDKITLKEFFESKDELAIHCDTEEKANKLLKEFDKLGKKWWSEDSYLKYNNFNDYKDKTCYDNDGAFCEIEFYKEENYKIYSFEDIIFEENNLIPEIAKMLGVEIGEEFTVAEQGYSKYKLDLENGFMYFENFGNTWIRAVSTLNELLLNIITIEKLPKEPQLSEQEYWLLRGMSQGRGFESSDDVGLVEIQSLEQYEKEIRKPLEDEIESLKKQLDLNDKEHFKNALTQLREADFVEEYCLILEEEIEMLNNRNNRLMLELRATRDKFLEFQDSYVKQVSNIIQSQSQILKFEDVKGLHNILTQQERQKVIAELEEWVEGYAWGVQDDLIYITTKVLLQKLEEIKGGVV